jgi:predicted nucleic acid-binding protein
LIVVSDTSPVLSLARIGRLEILRSLYDEVLIPTAVYEELGAATRRFPQIDLAAIPWLTVTSARDRRRVQELRAELDLGEAEAIVLALERHAELLLVDERRGRRTALEAGLTVTGLIGVVVQAKRAGVVTAARPVLDELIHTARFWIGPALYAEVLKQLDEK